VIAQDKQNPAPNITFGAMLIVFGTTDVTGK